MADYTLSAEIKADASGFTTGIKEAVTSLSGLEKALSKVSAKVKEFGAKVKEFGAKVGAKIKPHLEKLDKGVDKLNTNLKGFGVDLSKTFDTANDITKKFGLDLDKMAAKFGVSGLLLTGIATVTIALEKMGQAMDEATAEIVKGTGATGQTLRDLEHSFQDALINGVGAPVAEVAGAVADINTRFGVTGEELTELTDNFDAFAGVTGQDTRQAIASVADVMDKWNIKTESASVLMNQLTKASQDSGETVANLTASLKNGQAIFSQFGMSVTQSIAFLANLKKNGIDSSVVMTAMRTAMTNFVNQGMDAEEGLKAVSEQIKNATSKTEAMQIAVSTFGTRGGAEMVKVFRDGAMDISAYTEELENAIDTVSKTDEASRTAMDAWDDLKATMMGTFGQFGQAISALVKGVIDIFRNLLATLSPIINSIGAVVRRLITGFAEIFTKISGYIKDFAVRLGFSNGILTKILNKLASVIATIWEGIIWVFDKAYNAIVIVLDSLKIAFYSLVKVLAPIFNPVAEGIAKGFNFIIETINKGIQKLNWLADTLGAESFKIKEISTLDVGSFAIDTKEVDGKIKDLKAEINDLLKGTKKQTIETTEVVYKSQSSLLAALEGGASNAGEVTKKTLADISKWEDKLIAQKIQELEFERDNEIQRLQNRKATEEEILAVTQKYGDAIIKLKEEQIERERKAELAGVKGTENRKKAELKINEYYDNEIAKLHAEKVKAEIAQEEKKYSVLEEYQEKFKSQTLKILEAEERYAVQNAKSEAERAEIQAQFAQRRYEMSVRELELEKAKAVLKAKNGGDVEGIKRLEEYYRTELMLLEESYKATLKNSEMQKVATQDTKKLGDESTSTLKKIGKGADKVVKTIVKIVKYTYKAISVTVKTTLGVYKKLTSGLVSAGRKITSVFKSLFNFDTSDALDSLLVIEDKILTFFYEGASKIPAFVSSVLQSVEVLVGNVANLINFDTLGNSLDLMITEIVSKVPAIAQKIIGIVGGLIKTVGESIGRNAKPIADGIGTMVSSLLSELPSVLGAVVPAILDVINGLLTYIADNSDSLVQTIYNILDTLIDAVTKFISDGGLAKLIPAIVNLITTLAEAIADNLEPFVTAIVDSLPALFDGIAKVISTADDILPKIVSALILLVKGIIESLAELLSDDDFLNDLIDIIAQIVEEIAIALIELAPVLVKAVVKIAFAIIKNLPEILTRLLQVPFNILKNLDWEGFFEDFLGIFEELWDGLVNMFTSWFEYMVDVGKNLIKGLWEGISGFASWLWKNVKNFFSDLLKKIKNLFGIHSPSTVFAEIGGNMIKGLWQGIQNFFGTLWDNCKSLFSSFASFVSDVFGSIGSTISGAFSSAFNGVSSFISSAMNAFSSFGSWLSSTFSSIVSGVSSVLSSAVSTVSSGLSNVMGSVSSGLSSAVSTVTKAAGNAGSAIVSGIKSAGSAIASGTKRVINKLKFWATGTNDAPSGLAVVGEAGPELVRFRGGEQVLNASNTQKALSGMGGKTNNFSIVFNNTADTTAYTVMRQMRQYSRQMAINGVL